MGNKIGAVNDAVVNVLPMLDEISETNPDAEIKVAIAIGDDADLKVLEEFTGTNEAVFTVHNIDALKQIIRVVAVTSSQIGSKSSSAGDATKQDQVVEEVKAQIENIDGAEAATQVDSSSYSDDWD